MTVKKNIIKWDIVKVLFGAFAWVNVYVENQKRERMFRVILYILKIKN